MSSLSQHSLLHPPFEAHPSRPSSPHSTSSLRPNIQLDTNPSPHHSPDPNSVATSSWSPSAHSHQGDFVSSPTHQSPARNPFSTPDRPQGLHKDHQSTTRAKQTRPVPSEIFYQLDQIKQLHTQIAAEHAKLEKVGARVEVDGGAEREGASTKEGTKKSKDDKGSGTSSKGKGEGYQKMADQFESRKAGVEQVMAKLSLLSDSLKKFHSLPSPVLFPSHSHHSKAHQTVSTLGEPSQSPPSTPQTHPGPRTLRNRIQSHAG